LIHEILDWRYVNELVAHQRTRWDDNWEIHEKEQEN
jgi:hypothetical protein